MDTKEVQKKLQDAYHSMLEHVEELVDKDKLPLKDAFTKAEEKLSEWKELSREEVDHISQELKENLSDVGEVSHRLNESLKETLSFDTAYVANNLWDKLSKVADKTVVELTELGNTLKANMRTDAANYSEQQEAWFNDAMKWQGDYETALKQLDKIRADLRKKMRKVNAYSKAIINDKASQEEHNLLAQENMDTTHAINDLYYAIHSLHSTGDNES